MFTAVFTGYICLLWIVLGKGAQNSKQWPNDQRFFEGGGELRILECFLGNPIFHYGLLVDNRLSVFFLSLK